MSLAEQIRPFASGDPIDIRQTAAAWLASAGLDMDELIAELNSRAEGMRLGDMLWDGLYARVYPVVKDMGYLPRRGSTLAFRPTQDDQRVVTTVRDPGRFYRLLSHTVSEVLAKAQHDRQVGQQYLRTADFYDRVVSLARTRGLKDDEVIGTKLSEGDLGVVEQLTEHSAFRRFLAEQAAGATVAD